MSWEYIVKAKTGSKGGGSKPDRKKVLTKPENPTTLHEDIKAFKEGKLEDIRPIDDELLDEDIEEMQELYEKYPELADEDFGDLYGWENISENPQWLASLKTPKPYTMGDAATSQNNPLIEKLKGRMVDNVVDIFREFELFLESSGFETYIIEPDNQPIRHNFQAIHQHSRPPTFDNLFPLYVKLIKQLKWDDEWMNDAQSQGFDVSKNVLWGVKTIEYDVKPRTGANVRRRIKEISSRYEYETEPAGKPSKVHVLIFMRGTIDFETLDYKFYTLKYTTAMEKDILPSSKTHQSMGPESSFYNISEFNYKAFFRNMLNGAETDVLTIGGDEPDSTIINKLKSFFGYYLRL